MTRVPNRRWRLAAYLLIVVAAGTGIYYNRQAINANHELIVQVKEQSARVDKVEAALAIAHTQRRKLFKITRYLQGRRPLPGKAGPSGKLGGVGAVGLTGSRGGTGARGLTGDTGSRGSTGNTGDTGSIGTAGSQGERGPQGEQGPAGPPGPPGASCPNTTTIGTTVVCIP